MSWKCVLVDSIDQYDSTNDMPIGTMWTFDNEGEQEWCVKMPGVNSFFCSNTLSTQSGQRWQITGTPPNVTVHPSINIVGTYHGFIRNGVITNDLNGKKYK